LPSFRICHIISQFNHLFFAFSYLFTIQLIFLS
jgi:hypothetical protein